MARRSTRRRMAGAHQTLQLPAIVRVTNLENGPQVAGPGQRPRPGQRRAALLGADAPRGRPARACRRAASRGCGCRWRTAPSQALRDQLAGGADLAIAAAPRGAVTAESAAAAAGRRAVRRAAAVAAPAPRRPIAPSAGRRRCRTACRRRCTQVPPQPGPLWICGRAVRPARLRESREGKASRRCRPTSSACRRRGRPSVPACGPARSPPSPAADAALDQARAAGVTDARIVVE